MSERHIIHQPVISHLPDGRVIVTQDEEHTFTGDAWLTPAQWNRAVVLDGEVVQRPKHGGIDCTWCPCPDQDVTP